MNAWMLLDIVQEALPDRVGITMGSTSLTYHELAQLSTEFAKGLKKEGARSVAYAAQNSPAFPVAMFGAFRAGSRLSPLNYRLPDEDLNAIVGRGAWPGWLVVDDGTAKRVTPHDDVHVVSADELLRLDRTPDDAPPAEDVEPAVVLYTSGTTGKPKEARLHHDNLTAYVLNTVEALSADPDDATLVCVPPYHIAAVSAILTSVFSGRRIVYLPQFDPQEWIRAVRDNAVTHAMVVPTMFKRILDLYDPKSGDLASLRHLAYGGGRMDPRTIVTALEMLPDTNFVNAYGLTETSSTVALLGPEDHRIAFQSDDPVVRRRLHSVGQPVPGIEIEVRSPDGEPAGPGQPGEVHVRGGQISGVYGEESPRLLPGGWFPTKDQGWIDEAGYLFLEGRLDDVIVRGGENISPGEIEDVLREHPSVADAAVVGVKDEEWGETVGAAIVASAGNVVDIDDVSAYVRSRLRSTKVPARFVLVEELPYNETGKLVRPRVRVLFG